jgi:hypothetical protein
MNVNNLLQTILYFHLFSTTSKQEYFFQNLVTARAVSKMQKNTIPASTTFPPQTLFQRTLKQPSDNPKQKTKNQ